jgi:ABC-2 type transport system ATP-binding protein
MVVEGELPAVEIQGLTKHYGDKVAVDRLSFTVRRGEFFGFLGPNGAGKSTTIKMLCGLIEPTEGSARVAGFDVGTHPLEVKQRIGILPEEIFTYERLTGFELLTFVGRLYGMEESEIHGRAIDLFQVLDFTPEDASKLIIDYSMGMKKKIALASALIHSPEVLFLDEPFNGIDAVTSRSIRQILQKAVRSGITIFFSSHVLEVVERLCHRIAIIHEGKLAALGSLDEVRGQQAVSGDTTLDDLFVQLVAKDQAVVELDWLRSQ